jgi:hypothetical protein
MTLEANAALWSIVRRDSGESDLNSLRARHIENTQSASRRWRSNIPSDGRRISDKFAPAPRAALIRDPAFSSV